MAKERVGVLLMSYGTPASMEELKAYYTHIRHGRPPSEEELARLKARYEAIGGVSPLREHTDRQGKALEERLGMSSSFSFRVYQGLRHAPPFIEDAVLRMKEEGVRRAVGIVLAPHYSRMSVGGYIERAMGKAERIGLPISFVERYGLHPLFIEMWTEYVREGIKRLKEAPSGKVRLYFTAHSLPARIVEESDPYPGELFESAKAIATAAGMEDWDFAWQSAGQTSEKWLGPDLLEKLPALQAEGIRKVLVAPIGFVSEHLEILYDLDIEAKNRAKDLNILLERTKMPGTDPRFIDTLAEMVLQKLSQQE